MSASVSVVGRELIAAWRQVERGIAVWVLRLAEFDASGAWAEDGYASCASWLTGTCDLARSTAHEKLKVAHELTRRPVVRAAYEGGLSYSKVRLLVRLVGLDPERDQQFVAHASVDTVQVLERRVSNWNYYATQDKAPAGIDDHYGIRRQRGFGGGLGRVIIEAPDDMLDRLFALLDAYGNFLHHNSNGEPRRLGLVDDPVDESAMQTPQPYTEVADFATEAQPTTEPPSDTEAARPRSARRLDWLFDLFEEVALADPHKLDPQVAAVGVTIQYEDLVAGRGAGLSDQGSVLSGETIRKLCCDAGIHRIVVRGKSEILDYGREQRLFNRAQRRAIRFRHGHVCAVKGCGRRITHIHHLNWWENGGETNIANGIPACSYHHHLVHDRGWTIDWNTHTGLLRFIGPQNQTLDTNAEFVPRIVA